MDSHKDPSDRDSPEEYPSDRDSQMNIPANGSPRRMYTSNEETARGIPPMKGHPDEYPGERGLPEEYPSEGDSQRDIPVKSTSIGISH